MGLSCEFLQGGLALRTNTIAACGIIHHDRGQPVLATYRGGPLDLEELLLLRKLISDGTHPACAGCPHLTAGTWREPKHAVTWLGITHFDHCNLACDYCWLQWADYSPRRAGVTAPESYPLMPVLRQLIDAEVLSPEAVIDWGGGGESTVMPDFDDCFKLLVDHGTIQWLHTNAVRIPKSIEAIDLPPGRLKVLCSVDAGFPETFQAMKGSDRLPTVLRNLQRYRNCGGYIAAKYIVTPANCSEPELDAFLAHMLELKADEVIGDIDHRFADAAPEIVHGLAYLKFRCGVTGLPFVLGSTGINHSPESGIELRVRDGYLDILRHEVARQKESSLQDAPPQQTGCADEIELTNLATAAVGR